MKVIYKYEIRPDSTKDASFEIRVVTKLGAKPLYVALQNGIPCVWMEVDKARASTTITLYSVGTGFGAVPDDGEYLGTIIEGPYVWHIYVKKEKA